MALGTSIVVGDRGFIGSQVRQRLMERGIDVVPVTRETPPAALPASPVDAVFFCAGSSAASRAQRDPLFCLGRNVADAFQWMNRLRYRKWLHLSSASVYPPTLADKSEEVPLDPRDVPVYGAHKLLAETYVRNFTERWVVVRPGYLFGPGLRKNLLYDLREGGRDVYLTRDSYVDPLDVRHLADACVVLAEAADNITVNMAAGHPVRVQDLLAWKPAPYAFHDERALDERGLALDRLHRHWRPPFDYEEHRLMLRRFIVLEGEPSTS